MEEGNRKADGIKPLRSRQVDEMQGEVIGTGCDTKEGLVVVVGLSDWMRNGIEQLAGVHREERVRPTPTTC
jgi:hypothetical protein